MTLFVPVQSPVASYEATGASVWSARRIASKSQRLHSLLRRVAPSFHGAWSHDSSSLTPPSPRRRRYAAVAVLLPLSATVSACRDADAGYLVLPLPASTAVLLGAGLLFLLAGIGLGVCVALAYLRASDRAAAQYHRAQIARVLGASSSVHASVQEVLSIVHRRTQELQRLVAMLQRGGAK
ncbi:MAG: hypothetical protein ABI779_01305 [Acidobacteriota bacterium]